MVMELSFMLSFIMCGTCTEKYMHKCKHARTQPNTHTHTYVYVVPVTMMAWYMNRHIAALLLPVRWQLSQTVTYFIVHQLQFCKALLQCHIQHNKNTHILIHTHTQTIDCAYKLTWDWIGILLLSYNSTALYQVLVHMYLCVICTRAKCCIHKDILN